MRRREGFTLIEVLVAAFVATLVFGFLVSWMAQNLRSVGAARAQQHALLLGEQRARDFDLELRQSGLVEPGVEHGEFPEPDADKGWEVTVEAWQLPLPADYAFDTSPSPLFEPTGRQPEAADPPLHRVSVRVFSLEAPDTDLIAPFVLFGVVPGESPQTAGGAVAGVDPAIDTDGNGTITNDELKAYEDELKERGRSETNSGGPRPDVHRGSNRRRTQNRDDRARDPMGRR